VYGNDHNTSCVDELFVHRDKPDDEYHDRTVLGVCIRLPYVVFSNTLKMIDMPVFSSSSGAGLVCFCQCFRISFLSFHSLLSL
jgi:hypothetical protein